MRLLFTILTLVLIIASSGLALDFKITEVIPVGPISEGGMIGPAEWSPDGTRLAFFSGGALVISDTLGASHEVAEVDMSPHRFVWQSNDEILVFLRRFLDGNSGATLNRMVRMNVETGEQMILEEFTRQRGQRAKDIPRIFQGPYLTVEGNAYYHVEEQGVETVQMAPGLSPEKASPSLNHILRAGSDALYLVQVDYKDSVKISNKPYEPYMTLPMHVSPDRSHIMFGGVIVRLVDDELLILDTLIEKYPMPDQTDGCGFGSESFNPRFGEVAFSLSCDDGHSYVFRRIGVFDYATYQFTILDSLIDLNNCKRPRYAPDGKRLSFMSDGVLYVLNREF